VEGNYGIYLVQATTETEAIGKILSLEEYLDELRSYPLEVVHELPNGYRVLRRRLRNRQDEWFIEYPNGSLKLCRSGEEALKIATDESHQARLGR
jgi:hypothetical protein